MIRRSSVDVVPVTILLVFVRGLTYCALGFHFYRLIICMLYGGFFNVELCSSGVEKKKSKEWIKVCTHTARMFLRSFQKILPAFFLASSVLLNTCLDSCVVSKCLCFIYNFIQSFSGDERQIKWLKIFKNAV